MRKALVFIATFVAVLIAGVAFAYMAAPGDDSAEGASDELKEKPTTTSVQKDVRVETLAEEPEEPEEKEPPKEEPKEEPTEEEPKEEEPQEESSPPEIHILYPEEGAHFKEKHLAFEGEVTPGSEVWAAGYQAEVDEEGHWRIVLILSPGGNLAKFTAVNEAGLESVATVKVYLDVEEEPKEEPKEHEFTAHQKYGSCSDAIAYDVWYGTGTPGTGVWIGSEFGSNQTTIGEKGKWDLKVKFPEAPCNQPFQVVLETDEGHRKVYEFVRLCEEESHEGGEGEDHPEEPK